MAMESMFSLLIGIILAVWLIALVILILQVIGQWKTFKKAGKGGWEALIPIYNVVVQCRIVGLNPLWIVLVICGGMILNLIPVIGQVASSFLSIYFAVVLAISTARSYGKDDGFGVGLLLLGPVFWMILGLSSAEYVGAKPMNDPVWNFVSGLFGGKNSSEEVISSTTNNTTNTANNKFCTQCGLKLEKDTKFCPSCGNKVN